MATTQNEDLDATSAQVAKSFCTAPRPSNTVFKNNNVCRCTLEEKQKKSETVFGY